MANKHNTEDIIDFVNDNFEIVENSEILIHQLKNGNVLIGYIVEYNNQFTAEVSELKNTNGDFQIINNHETLDGFDDLNEAKIELNEAMKSTYATIQPAQTPTYKP